VSDLDRETVVEQLAAHAVAGRLNVDELATRTEEAYSARTVGDLALVLRDLPAVGRSVGGRGAWVPLFFLARFRFQLLALVTALVANLGVLTVVGDGIGGPPGSRGVADELATATFWVLAAWITALVAGRAAVAVLALYRGAPDGPRPLPSAERRAARREGRAS